MEEKEKYFLVRQKAVPEVLLKVVEAKKLLDSTGADHVLYGRKLYDKEWNLAEIRFYLLPMDDERFERDIVPLTNQLVYALHSR